MNAIVKSVRQKSLSLKKASLYLQNVKYLGSEPDPVVDPATGCVSDTWYQKTLTWYNYMHTAEDARAFLATYLKQEERGSEWAVIKRVPDERLPLHAAWIARMLTRKVPLQQRSIAKMNQLLYDCLRWVAPQRVATPQQVSVQDRMRDKASDVIALIEQRLDTEGPTFSVSDILNHNDISAALCPMIRAAFEARAAESAQLLRADCDPQLAEGYSRMTAKQLIEQARFYHRILQEIDRHGNVTKKPRKKRVVAPSKKVKAIKALAKSEQFGVQSVSAEKVVGAEEAWLLNERTRVITRLVAGSALDVKGQKVIGLDEEKSFSYRTGRKTAKLCKQIAEGGKRACLNALKGLKTTTLQPRINRQTIIMKVF